MSDMQVRIRAMEESDKKEVAKVHMKSFKGFFLTVLGTRFLETLYSYFVMDKSGIAYIAVDSNDRVIGFVAGSLEPEGFYTRALKTKLFSFCIASISPILKKPGIILRLLRAFNKPGESRELAGYSELMSIGVLPEAIGTGVGRLLEETFCQHVTKYEGKYVTLTTDKLGNDHVNNFYISCGYHIMNEFITKEKREMYRYLKEIN